MSFTLAATLLTLVVVGALLWPIARARRLPGRSRYDLEIYRDQLAEVGRDAERGVIKGDEARAAKLEIERRLLRAAGESEPETVAAPVGRIGVIAAAVAVPVLALLVYANLGAPRLPDLPFAARERAPDEAPDIQEMVAKLEKRLADQPNDVEGWLMLGRSKGVLGDQPAAVEAYRKAVALAPQDPRPVGELAESLVVASGEIVTPESKTLFAQLATLEPRDPRPAYYLGFADVQAGDEAAAIERWRKLLAESPSNAPWRQRVVDALRDAAKQSGADADAILASAPGTAPVETPPPQTATAGPGPTPEQAAAVAQMPPEQQQAMIRSMVDRLAAKMEADGSDVEGWRRLAQARVVLGETDAAKAVYVKALALHPDDPGLLRGYATVLLGPAEQKTGLPEVGQQAAELFEKVVKLDPKDPESNWYLGIRALQGGQKDAARSHWQVTLAALDPSSEDYKAVKKELDGLGS